MELRSIVHGAALLTLSCAVVSTSAVVLAEKASAMGGKPVSKIDCRKKKNKKQPECTGKPAANSKTPKAKTPKDKTSKNKVKESSLTDDELYQAGYWLARTGNYEAALVELRQVKNQNDPRILNYIGFATRKLGRVTEAMGYYNRVLKIDPNYTLARAYLAEAYLEQGNAAAAKSQLIEIEQRCGKTCVEYLALAEQISSFKANGTFKPQNRKLGSPSKRAG